MLIQRFTIRMAAVLACGLIAAGSAALALQAPPKRPNAGQGAPASGRRRAPRKRRRSRSWPTASFERGDASAPSPESWKTGRSAPRGRVPLGPDRRSSRPRQPALEEDRPALLPDRPMVPGSETHRQRPAPQGRRLRQGGEDDQGDPGRPVRRSRLARGPTSGPLTSERRKPTTRRSPTTGSGTKGSSRSPTGPRK